jgi:hypothetical protein
MTSIKSLLDQAIATNKQRATSRDVTTTENSKGATALISLEPLSVLYGKVISSMETGQQPPPSADAAPLPLSFIKKK